MKLRLLALIAAVLLVGSSLAFGQVVNGNLTGTVMMDNAPLPGVTVTITSPNMQGTRSTTSDVNGNYNFAALPPGTYKVTFEMQGMANIVRTAQVGVGQTGRADATMHLTSVAEAITVTASAPAVLETTDVSTNLQQQTINKLPTGRTVTGVALLAPGTASTGPRASLVMGGATADQNLITVDGANIQENLRGQTHGLFIEDAIQETTVLTGVISAEYGRFTGGVVNSITKSGGNEFHGTYRDNLSNTAWTLPTNFPGDVASPRTWNQVHEATFGGRIVRDRLWFFGAGRKTKSTNLVGYGLAAGAFQQFPVTDDAKRWEGKLTGQVTPKHSLVVTYLKNPLNEANNCQLGCLETAGIDPSITQVNDFWTGHYNGILTNNLLVEALYSRKRFVFVGFGGDNRDQVLGSPLLVFAPGAASIVGDANAPYFCGICGNESRNNHESSLKGTYFFSSKALGTHNVVAGYDKWAETRFSNNYQSPTNYVLNSYSNTTVRDPATGTIYLDLTPGVDWIAYYPILTPSLGSNLRTNSAYVNDKWDFNTHWSFNVGVRYDANNSINSLHQTVSNNKGWSPRLGAIYDVTGNGKFRITAGYNTYVGRLAEGVTSATSAAGNPASFYYQYEGPALTHLTSNQYSAAVFSWWNGLSAADKQNVLFAQNIPGSQTVIAGGSLAAQSVRELSLGASMAIGNGFIRGDIINRKWKNFYVNERTTGVGTILINGDPADLNLLINSDIPKRTYNALELQGQYRFFANLNVGGNYTYSKLRGNIVGENAGSGPTSENFGSVYYPEYNGFARNFPVGYLPSDQRHKLRLWATYDFATRFGGLNVGAIERYDSGTPYSAAGSIAASAYVAANPGYASPPSAATYFFSDRGVYRMASNINTDLSSTFSFPTIHGLEFYVEGYVFNIFNAQKIVNFTNPTGGSQVVNTTVRTSRTSGSGLKAFNPFTTAAVQCPTGDSAAQCSAMNANWQLTSAFGTATNKAAYQTPRSYSLAGGFRF